MGPRVRLTLKNDPLTFYESRQEEFLIGRSKDCEMVIKDPAVSQLQARVRFQNEIFIIENLGRNPTRVNGIPVETQSLRAGDQITVGRTELLFHVEEEVNGVVKEARIEDKTMVFSGLTGKTLGPQLVLTTLSGESSSYPLEKELLLIGRASEADVCLNDPSVSLRHCMIEKRESGFLARNLSQTNPLKVNDQTITETRLYSGDQLRVGPFSISFFSDRPQDLRSEKKIISQAKRPRLAVWLLTAIVLLGLGSYVFYKQVYRPWEVKRTLETVSRQMVSGSYIPALSALTTLLETDLPAKERQKARELLSKSTLAVAQKMGEDGKLQEAKQYLVTYLKNYGSDKEANPIWERLDLLRLNLAHLLVTRGEHEAALREFAAIREDGPWFNEAQKGIRRIWLASEQQPPSPQTKAQLLREAEEHFLAQRYLIPVDNNAYSAYKAVLALDPENALARQRIGQMRDFYRKRGEMHYRKGNWRKALSYFERYTFIEPNDPTIKGKLSICKRKLLKFRFEEKSTHRK